MPPPRSQSPTARNRGALENAIAEMNNTVAVNGQPPAPVLSAVASELGGNNHPYGFDRTDHEYVVLSHASASAIAADARKMNLRCWDENRRQIPASELACRVYAVHKGAHSRSEWFEPSVFGANALEYWTPKFYGLVKGIFILLTMFAVNYARSHYAREFDCHWVSDCAASCSSATPVGRHNGDTQLITPPPHHAPQPTVYNLYGIIDTPICAGLKWLETFFNGVQQSFVYGGAAAVAYAIPSLFGWRIENPPAYA